MKKEFKQYIESLELSNVMNDIIEKKFVFIERAFNSVEFEDIFLSEMISTAGSREYLSLWAFTQKQAFRIAITKDDLSVIDLRTASYISIYDTNYDFILPTENSKMRCGISQIYNKAEYSFAGSGINCAKLVVIMNKYLIAH